MQWMTEWARILNKNRPFLVQHLSTSEALLDELISIDLIILSEEENIKAKETSGERNRRFLEVLSRKSHTQIQQLIEVLIKCGQPCMADCFREMLSECEGQIYSRN